MMLAYLGVVLGLGVALYILIGYPLLLAWIPWKPGPEVRKDLTFQPSVTVILAVYNGEAFLQDKLASILALRYPQDRMQILVVSDGSTDKSDAIARSYADRGVTLLRVPHAGKSAAVNRALEQATGDILFFTDVRQPLDPMALAHLAANFADPTVGGVTGEMHLFQGSDSGEQADMGLYWRYEVWARKIHSRIDSIFASTGCIYAIRRELAEPIPNDTLSDDAILPLRAFLKGYRVILDPEAIATDYPALPATEFRRRCRNLGGLWQTFWRLPQLFGPKNRMWLHFLSHKFGRLLLPWACLLAAVSALALPASWFRTVLLLAGGGIAGLALLDRILPKTPLKRLTSPAHTFFVMNAASAVAIRVFLGSANKMWIPTQVDPKEGE